MDNSATARYVGIAESAVNRGHQVSHFTSTFRHPKKKHRFEESKSLPINENYEVNYIYSMGYQRNMEPQRFIAHLDFANKLLKHLETLSTPDAIIMSMPPLSVAHKITAWARNKKIPTIVDIIDPWPDSFIKDVPSSVKSLGKIAITPFYNKLKALLHQSTALSSISKGYLDWAFQYHRDDQKMVRYFYPAVDYDWINTKINDLKEEIPRQDNKLRLIYAGSLASSYDIPSICKAAEILEQKYPNQTDFIIAGTGPQEAMVMEYQKKLPNFTYLGWINRDELTKQYYLSDLGFIQHMNSKTQTVTYKLFSYLSAGLPVLNSLQSEMVDIINENRVGLNNKEGDYEQLIKNIEQFILNPKMLEEYKANALNLTAQKGDVNVVYDHLVEYIEEIARNYH